MCIAYITKKKIPYNVVNFQRGFFAVRSDPTAQFLQLPTEVVNRKHMLDRFTLTQGLVG